MSDDDLAYSPFDDFEDMLYDADPAPDLADDLAEHVANSPVWQDDPGYEILDVHSDWEYYSDDFYDDDPVLLKSNPQDGSTPKRASKGTIEQEHGKRGRKRKLADTEGGPTIDLGERKKLKDCIKGTVWARPIPERHNTFQEGEEEKVALMKDWRNKFGTRLKATHTDGMAQPQLNRDESWANDMSLADMGLLNSRETMLGQEDKEDDAEEHGEAEDGSVDETEFLEAEDLAAAAATTLTDSELVIKGNSAPSASPQPTTGSTRKTENESSTTHVRKSSKRTELPSPSTTASSLSQQPTYQATTESSRTRKRKADDVTIDSEANAARLEHKLNDTLQHVPSTANSSTSNTTHRQKRTASTKAVKSMAESISSEVDSVQAQNGADRGAKPSSKRVTRSRKNG